MLLLGFVARPIVWLLTVSSNLVLKAFGDSTNFLEAKLTRDDLEHLVEEARAEGGLDAPAGRLMARTMEFLRLSVADVMVPRRFMVTVGRDAGEAELRDALLEKGHRRVPVHGGSRDEVVGYLLREDVLACLWDGRRPVVADLLREPFFVPEPMPAERALRELQRRRLHLAIVADEHGATAGLVTIEDLIEELVGELFHERDVRSRPIEPVGPGAWRLAGMVTLRDVWHELHIELPERGEGRTVSGLLVALAGDRVPGAGERFVVAPGLELEVVEASARRVRVARLSRTAPPPADG
jgi:putative hemolysin